MTARTHEVSLGVLEAENRRDARILAEYLRDQQRFVNEMGEMHIYFVSPSVTQETVLKTCDEYEKLGVYLNHRWLFDERGNRKGVALHGRVFP